MFVLPRPPNQRDGRRPMNFSFRPVNDGDVSHHAAKLQPPPVTAADRVVHDDGVTWFPSSACNATFQEEFAHRTLIINERLGELDELRLRFSQTRTATLMQLEHALHFDEQWERETIIVDATADYWNMLRKTTIVIVASQLLREEQLGRASLERLAFATFLHSTVTGEYFSRQHMATKETVARSALQQRHLREEQLLAAVIEPERRDRKFLEEEALRRLNTLRIAESYGGAATRLVVEEHWHRKTLMLTFFAAQRSIVLHAAESSMSLLFKLYYLDALYPVSFWELMKLCAIRIQSEFRRWSAQRKFRQRSIRH